LQLDVSGNFLGHEALQLRVQTPKRLPGYLRVYPSDDKTPQPRAAGLGFSFSYAFSTWLNSNSTGVERPKISTATWIRLFS